jgi:hypothetical protein
MKGAYHSSVDECQRRKFPAKKPRDMLKLGSGANTGLPKYFLKLSTKANAGAVMEFFAAPVE